MTWRSGSSAGRRALGAALFLGVALAAFAAPVSAVETWRTAALWGGDVTAIAFAPADPNVAVAGTAAGHVYLSRRRRRQLGSRRRPPARCPAG